MAADSGHGVRVRSTRPCLTCGGRGPAPGVPVSTGWALGVGMPDPPPVPDPRPPGNGCPACGGTGRVTTTLDLGGGS
jgi:hypothetical protein